MQKQELSAFWMILAASLLGSFATVSFSGCKPPTAVPREDSARGVSYSATNNRTGSNSTGAYGSNMTGSGNMTWSSNTTGNGNRTLAAETPITEVPVSVSAAELKTVADALKAKEKQAEEQRMELKAKIAEDIAAAEAKAKAKMEAAAEAKAIAEKKMAEEKAAAEKLAAEKAAEAKRVAEQAAATVAMKAKEAAKSSASPEAAPAISEAVSPEEVLSSGGDWPQWGGTRLRNNVPNVTGLPETWNIGKFDRRTGDWDKSKAENIAWYANLGSQTYGNPVVADGRVFVGTNNGAGHQKRYSSKVDLGCLLAFNEKDGSFLWQHSSEKLPTGRVHDWPLQGICCAPLVEGNRLWFVTSRGEVRCLDTEGFYDDEDDGPVKAEVGRVLDLPAASDGGKAAIGALAGGKVSDSMIEALKTAGEEVSGDVQVEAVTEGSAWKLTGTFAGVERTFSVKKAGPNVSVFKTILPADKREADTVWIFNMMQELGVSQHNMCACSVTCYGDYLFVNSSNGLDESHINLPSPDAPTFLCFNKTTGELLWSDASPGTNILHGQWSSPTVAVLGGVPQALFCGGDGWLYSFKADGGGDGKGELLWKFDCNPKESKWILGGEGTRNNLIATPVIYNDLVYIAVGQDPEHGEGEGHFWCIDPNKRGNVSPQLAMRVDGDSRTEIPPRRIQAVEPENGEIAVDNPNSAALWHYTMSDINEDGEIDFEEEMHRSIGTCAIKDNLIYVADFSGLLHCLDARGENGEPKVYFTYDMLAQSWGSPLISDGRVYVGDEDGDVAIFEFGSENVEPIEEINMGTSVYSTPIAANGRIYISTKDKLFAIEKTEE